MKQKYIITYDVGSTGNKTCLFSLGETLELVARASQGYDFTFVGDDGVEQDPEDWWKSMKDTTHTVLKESGVAPEDVAAMSFCSQMQGLVLVDKDGKVLRPAMSYMDARASQQYDRWHQGLQVAGLNARKTLISLKETGVVAGSAKDPVFRYAWVKEQEPDIFSRIYKWLDVKDYLIYRATHRMIATHDTAFGTLLFNPKKVAWSPSVCQLHEVDINHLPEILAGTDTVGPLTAKAAEELGLSTNCKVIAGGGDATLIAIGAGCTCVGDTHIYIGTSGWVSTVVDRQLLDIGAMIGSVSGAQPGRYNYFAEMETSGKCIDWARDHLLMDAVGIYDEEADPDTVIQQMSQIALQSSPGSNGVIFMPWLMGNRCPFEDPDARGGFFNVSLTTTKADLSRSVFEGILFHKRWMLEAQERKTPTSSTLHLVGGGAQSDVICQMLADMTGRPVDRPESLQDAGALGAAILIAYALGRLPSLDQARSMVKVDARFAPNPETKAAYDKNYAVFQRLHPDNAQSFRLLNREGL